MANTPKVVAIVVLFLVAPGCSEFVAEDYGPGVIIFRNGKATGWCDKIERRQMGIAPFYVCHEKDGITQYGSEDVATIKNSMGKSR